MATSDPGQADGPDAAKTTEENRTTAQSEDLDYAELNDLFAFIRELLTSDVYGNFYIRGSHSTRDGRHGNLQVVIKLNDLLEKVIALKESEKQEAAAAAASEGKKGGRITLTQRKAIREKFEKVQQTLQAKLEGQGQELTEQLDVLSKRIKKLEIKESASLDKIKTLEYTIEQKEWHVLRLGWENARLLGSARQAEEENQALKARVEQLEATVKFTDVKVGTSYEAAHLETTEHDDNKKSFAYHKAVQRGKDHYRDGTPLHPEEEDDSVYISDDECYTDEVHITIICEHVQRLESFLTAEDAVVLHKMVAADVRRLRFRGKPGDYYEARAAARRLFDALDRGERVHIVKGERSTLVELDFGGLIPEGWVDGSDYGTTVIGRKMRWLMSTASTWRYCHGQSTGVTDAESEDWTAY